MNFNFNNDDKVTIMSDSDWSILNVSFRDNKIEPIMNYIKEGKDIDARYERCNDTLLRNAASFGRYDAMKVILEAGADPKILAY